MSQNVEIGQGDNAPSPTWQIPSGLTGPFELAVTIPGVGTTLYRSDEGDLSFDPVSCLLTWPATVAETAAMPFGMRVTYVLRLSVPNGRVQSIAAGSFLVYNGPVDSTSPASTVLVGPQGPAGPPGTGAGAAVPVVCAESVLAGSPVYVDRVTRQVRNARADTYLACFVAGLAAAETSQGFAVDVLDGPVALLDWTAATGAADLTPGLVYFVGLTGGLTPNPPLNTPGATAAAAGRAVDARTLLVSPSNPIKL